MCRVVLATRQFEKHQCVQCVTFDQKGKFVGKQLFVETFVATFTEV